MRIHPFRIFSSFSSSSSLSFFSSIILIFLIFIIIIHIKQHVLDERLRRESNSAPILIFHHSYPLSSSSLIILTEPHPHLLSSSSFIILTLYHSQIHPIPIFNYLHHPHSPYTPPHVHHPYHYLYQIRCAGRARQPRQSNAQIFTPFQFSVSKPFRELYKISLNESLEFK